MGHWKSVFSGFRGGDGMATLMGVTLAAAPSLAILGFVVGFAGVLILWRATFRSGWGIFACFTVMLVLSQYYQIDRNLVLGLSTLASLVLLRSVVTRRRRNRAPEEDLVVEGEGGLVDDLEPSPESEIGPAAPENR
jgi:glycerol-3-phosphate acyltransferase PlsY